MSLAILSSSALGYLGNAPISALFGNTKPKAAPTYPGALSPSEVGNTGLPGDVGFDPLGLANFDLSIDSATDKTRSAALVMRDYRDAELKHGRLAMLAAVAWPLQERLNPLLAARFHYPNLVAETGGLSPSVLNGGLEQSVIPAAVLGFAALISAVELHGLNIKAERGPAWVPGDFGTARIAEPGTEQFASLASGEIWNGRIAMIAMLAYVAQEALTKVPVGNMLIF